MIMLIEIRNQEERDIVAVQEIVRAAFPTDAESGLVDALRANGKAIISLVAVSDSNLLGQILFSPVSTSPPGDVRSANWIRKGERPWLANEYGADEQFMPSRTAGLVRYESEFGLFSV